MSKGLDHPSLFKAAPVAFFILGGNVRFIFLFILALPFSLYAACPSGIQLSNVPISTALPFCVKFESSSQGGCYVDCTGVCVEIPSAGTKGPITTTGVECSIGGGDGGGTDGGNGNGEGDGGGGEPVVDPIVGYKPFATAWIGGNAMTDISHLFNTLSWNNRVVSSSSVMRIGETFEKYLGGVNTDVDLIASQTHRISRSVESLPVDVRESKETLNRIENLLSNMGNSVGGDTGGSSGGTNNDTIESLLRDHLVKNSYGQSNNLSNIQSNTDTMQSMMGSQMRMFGEMTGMLDNISRNTNAIKDGLGGGSGGEGGGSEPGTGGDGIDYSKMPGSENNPMSVAGSTYKSSCNGDNCYFDVPGMEKKLEETRKALSDKYDDIARETKDVFSFNLSGAADPLKCFDLFSYQGKSFEVCPPSQDYWQTLAAMMMFIFYFIALMVIFKR
ncbi:hypothetical protein V1481_02695 [Aeromonas enteropelogenes]|uniref:hypothetical protein n=1 Tax=Aeromonas enteropelogenes TaxID=29489 RepID=UPI00313514E3